MIANAILFVLFLPVTLVSIALGAAWHFASWGFRFAVSGLEANRGNTTMEERW